MSMNNTVIIYVSLHHKNTEKLLKAITVKYPADLVDVAEDKTADIAGYEYIGIASGIAFGKYYPQMLEYLKTNLPQGKKVFFLHSAGSPEEKQCSDARLIAENKNCSCIGVYCCKGYDTYGPFRLIGGLNRNHPDNADVNRAVAFFEGLHICDKNIK